MLQSPSTRPYAPTAEDRLWLSRAVTAEGRPYLGVARALVNLFMLQRSKGNAQTLTTLVRAYAQPVNPRWFPTGDLFLAEGARSPLEMDQALKRQRVHSTLTAFPAVVQAAVAQALEEPYPFDVTDYAVPSLDASKKGYSARSVAKPGENKLWTREPGWRGYFVDGSKLLWPAVLLLAMLYIRSRNA